MVKEVTVTRDWPNGIKVVIVEREPWGRWRANNTVWAIDSEGVVLEGAAPSAGGPILTQVSALPAIKPGAVVDTNAVDMVNELHERGAPLPLPGVVAYEWSLTDGLTLITEHGHIIFGGADGFEYKYSVWDLLEREAHRRGEPLLFADLRFGLRPRVEIGLNLGRGIRIQDVSAASISASSTSQQSKPRSERGAAMPPMTTASVAIDLGSSVITTVVGERHEEWPALHPWHRPVALHRDRSRTDHPRLPRRRSHPTVARPGRGFIRSPDPLRRRRRLGEPTCRARTTEAPSRSPHSASQSATPT